MARVLVGLVTVVFAAGTGILLVAKWRNFDPFLLDFAKTTRLLDAPVRGIPFVNTPMNYYVLLYTGIATALLPVYAVFRSPAVLFGCQILCFAASMPLLYRAARTVPPGAWLPLAMVVGFALNPAIDITAIAFLRVEAAWMVLYFLLFWLANEKRRRSALLVATLACLARLDATPRRADLERNPASPYLWGDRGRASARAGTFSGTMLPPPD